MIEELNRCLAGMAREKKVIRGRKLRVDSTVVESDIHHPTDASLLADGIRVVTRIARQLKALGVAVRTKVRDRTRAVKKRLYAISRVLRRRTGEARKEVRALTGEVAEITQKVLGQAEGVVRNGRRVLARMEGRSRARAKALLRQLESYANRLWTAVIQSNMLQGGDMRIPERMVSLFDPDARPIVKGKAGKPVEFGYKVQLEETDHGVLTGYQVYRGHPPDSHLIEDGIAAHEAATGVRPKEAAADRGYYHGESERALQARGITVAIPKPGRKSAERRPWERTATFRRLQRWRAGAEARISLLKRKYGLCRSRLRGYEGTRTWVGLSVWADNLQRISALG